MPICVLSLVIYFSFRLEYFEPLSRRIPDCAEATQNSRQKTTKLTINNVGIKIHKFHIQQTIFNVYYRIIIREFSGSTMINPTFASFKSTKQLNSPPALGEISINMQPKTFQELKIPSNYQAAQYTTYAQKGHEQSIGPGHAASNWAGNTQKISFNNANSSRKMVLNLNLKKNYSEANFPEAQNKSQHDNPIRSKPKLNTKNILTAKKNYVQVEKLSKEKNTSRPSITGPSLLKNKSFIYTCKKEGKQNYLSRPSHEALKAPYHFYEGTSIDSMDRKSQQINISIGSSNSEGLQSYSFFNSSKLDDSISLKDSCKSNKLDHTLNFSRKSNQTIYKGQTGKYSLARESTCVGEPISSLASMARQMKSSFQSESSVQQPQKPVQTNSINFSRKFQSYKPPKQNIQPRIITLQQFELIDEMGEGKYGKVLLARHKPTGFICAIKSISKQKIKEENIEQPLIRQIKIQMYLNHPNIVKLYGFFHDADNLYLIMQSCLQGHLLKLIKQRKIFEQNQILDIISNVYEAVSFLHCHGIIHRDIKPENIVIQYGVHKICDFGWAAYAKGDTRTTFCGTPLYVCPEVLKGNQYDAKADVWGLGVMTYELAYGRVPFPIWSQSDMVKIVKDPVYFPTWTSVSDKMQNLIKSMLNKDPAKRLSLNQILASPLITEYVGSRLNLRSEMETLF